MKPTIVISSSQGALRVPCRKLTELIRFVAAEQGWRLAVVDLAIVGRRDIVAANRRWVGPAGPTDVISLDLSDSCNGSVRGKPRTLPVCPAPGVSVQLIVCGEVAVRQAALHGTTSQQELMLYVVHGLLHVMGHDDQTPRAAAKMHAREEELLSQFQNHHRR